MCRFLVTAPHASLFCAALVLWMACGCGAGSSETAHDARPASGAPFLNVETSPSRPREASEGLSETFRASEPRGDDRLAVPVESAVTERREKAKRSEETADFVPPSGRQAGVLTAGSFDDVKGFHEYASLMRLYAPQVQACQLPLNAQTRQTVIRITDGQGCPVADATCRVLAPGEPQVTLLNLRTGTDGRVSLLWNGSPQDAQQQPLRLQVLLADNPDAPVLDEMRYPDAVWDVVLPQTSGTRPLQLDLALVIDTTGSMGDELEFLKTEIDSIAECVHRMFPEVDQRYSLIAYRDQGDEYVCRTFDFTHSLSDFRRQLDAQSAGGGGDFPEAMDVALQNSVQLSWRSSATARVMFLVGDAPPHSDRVSAATDALQSLRQKGVRVFPIGASGVDKTAEILMRTASLLTMGQYLFLTDHSGVGHAHATPHVSAFAVERLDRLMVRMIASELAGRRLVPEDVLAIERGAFSPEQTSDHRMRTDIVPTVVTSPFACEPLPVAVHFRPSVPATVCESTSHPLLRAFEWCCETVRFHGLGTLMALVSCVMVFDRLNRRLRL